MRAISLNIYGASRALRVKYSLRFALRARFASSIHYISACAPFGRRIHYVLRFARPSGQNITTFGASHALRVKYSLRLVLRTRFASRINEIWGLGIPLPREGHTYPRSAWGEISLHLGARYTPPKRGVYLSTLRVGRNITTFGG